jgi:hypothetical protein
MAGAAAAGGLLAATTSGVGAGPAALVRHRACPDELNHRAVGGSERLSFVLAGDAALEEIADSAPGLDELRRVVGEEDDLADDSLGHDASHSWRSSSRAMRSMASRTRSARSRGVLARWSSQVSR